MDSSVDQRELVICSHSVGVEVIRVGGDRGQVCQKSCWEGTKYNKKRGATNGTGDRNSKSKLD